MGVVRGNVGIKRQQTIPNESRSESLCDGLAKRLFKNVYDYQYRELDTSVPGHEIVTQFKQWVQLLRFQKIARKKAINQIMTKFNMVFWHENSIAYNQKNFIVRYGAIIDQSKLYLLYMRVDEKKPHRTEIGLLPLSITKHVVSRVLFRLKPDDLIRDLKCIFTTLIEMIRLSEDTHSGKSWIILPTVGMFLVNLTSYIPNELIHGEIITFVDYSKLTEKQRIKGERQWEEYYNSNPTAFNSSLLYIKDLHNRKLSGVTTITNLDFREQRT